MSTYELVDRFTAERGTVFLSGTQALCRIPIEQLWADRRAGHRTAAFVAGYPGSPLGGFDAAMASAAKLAPDLPIVGRPSVNEEYAATAVMGSQLAAAQPDHTYDGVVGLWYGKAPGVDRATDALRHATYAGTSKLGGAVALVGDDPTAKSSTLPSSSAGSLADLHMPLLYPGDPAEALDLGRHAVALSRYSGLWSALKIVADVADGTASVELDIDRVQPVLPHIEGLSYDRPPEGRLLTPLTLDLEREIYEVRYELAKAYASANQLNRVTVDPPDAWIGIVASGITYREVLGALQQLGLDDEAAIAACGIRLIEMQMPIPFDARTIVDFSRGLDEVFIIEEKQPNIELMMKDALYSMPDRPTVVGKRDEVGLALVPGFGGLEADSIVAGLRARLERRAADRLKPAVEPRKRIPVEAIAVSDEAAITHGTDAVQAPDLDAAPVARSPFYCSGCPHNRSTEVPEGSLIGAGIGCHTMTLLMDPERVGDIAGLTPMGNEGTQWIGMAPFVDRSHFIQNLGDGTYFHSGQLAITAAIAAGVDITYKLLYNDAVAMTGGQDPQGQLGVAEVAQVLLTQGAAQVLITTDEPGNYRNRTLPAGVDVWDRTRLIEAQERLVTVPGVTVLIHDQACAAELRRARRRGKVATPTQRVVINHRVCEGCGDCGQVSNCLSVQPLDTQFGRKTTIDQTSCNFDYSCLEGDCPSFITVETEPGPVRRLLGRRARKAAAARLAEARSGAGTISTGATGAGSLESLLGSPLAAPVLAVPADEVALRIAGIGGTGVVTVAQVLGTAAMLDGFHVRGLDQVGLSQKAGPVVSDLRFTRGTESATNRLGAGQADVLLAFDQLVAASDRGLLPGSFERTVVVGSTSPTPTGSMITHPEQPLPSPEELNRWLDAVSRPGHRHWADAAALALRAFGDAMGANVLVVGMAVQAGALPIDPLRVEEALELNGVAVETNIAAFRLGRRVIADPDAVEAALGGGNGPGISPSLSSKVTGQINALRLSSEVEGAVRRFAADLVEFQDAHLASEFLGFLKDVSVAERRVDPASELLVSAVAAGLHKLLAYKDEYEVARLVLDLDGRREADVMVADGATLSYRLHPPLLRELGMKEKLALGTWADPVFKALASGKGLRGKFIDPFGHTKVRRAERALPGEYRAAIKRVLAVLSADNLGAAVELAELPDLVRGYEHLKMERVATFRGRLASQLRAITHGR